VPSGNVPSADAASAVLDASALLALLQNEEGAEVVLDAIEDGVAISVVNWAEVLSKLAEKGQDPATSATAIQAARADDEDALTIEPLTEADCVEMARLRVTTRPQGLSFGDRACLALAGRLEVPALTADHPWELAEVPVEIKLIR
jgi:ribonuclease VapC